MLNLLERVRRAPVWLRNRALQPAVILCYHRVTTLERDPHILALTPDQFEEHLIAIREIGTPVSLRELADAVRDGRWIRNGVVVTFDDGYADNLYEAKPLLEKHEIPATVFVATGQIGSHREFWWDALERLLLGEHGLPDRLRIPVGAVEQEWLIPDDARPPVSVDLTGETLAMRAALRTSVMKDVRDALLELHPRDVARAIEALHNVLGVSPTARDSHRCCSANELQALAGKSPGDSLVDLGAHTVSHPRLAMLDVGAQTAELRESRLVLESILGRPVTTAAYPFGRAVDVSGDTVAAARAAGIEAACTLTAGPLWATRIDPLMLPRYVVHPMDGDQLSRWLRYVALG
ncbi:MAG: polysaccharide deacetylase family protein [Gemmatimonadota bacterium]